MDINCPKCAEPIDNDELHEIASLYDMTYSEVLREFQVMGCNALDMEHNKATMDSFKSQVAGAMFELMGDDTDGVAAMMEDFEYMGMI